MSDKSKVFLLYPTLLIAFYGTLLALASKSGFPTGMITDASMPYLSDKPIGEDGYYMLLVAWNFAHGDGFAANFGSITTGVQPLAVIMFSGVAKLVQLFDGDKFDFARAMILFGTVNLVVFGYAVGALSRRLVLHQGSKQLAFLVAFSTATLSHYFYRTFTYGLETGIYLTLIAVTLERTVVFVTDPSEKTRNTLVLGVLIGLTGLARIDFGVVVAVVMLAFLLTRTMRLLDVVTLGVIALVIVAPWFIWVHAVSGSWLPSSGPAQGYLVGWDTLAARSGAMLLALAQNLSPWLFTGGRLVPTGLAVLGVATLAFLVYRKGTLSIDWCSPSKRIFVIWASCIFVLPVVYVTFFWATHFYARYASPISVVATVLISVSTTRLPGPARSQFFQGFVTALAVCNAGVAFLSLNRGATGTVTPSRRDMSMKYFLMTRR